MTVIERICLLVDESLDDFKVPNCVSIGSKTYNTLITEMTSVNSIYCSSIRKIMTNAGELRVLILNEPYGVKVYENGLISILEKMELF